MKFPSELTLRRRLEAARAIFLLNDIELLRIRVHERSMTHKFAEALQTVFRSWDVDCEYNREGKIPKSLPELRGPNKTIYPDIIIHKRNSKRNLLIIEAKVSDASAASVNEDKRKLEAYVTGHLGYRFSLMLTFVVGNEPSVIFALKKIRQGKFSPSQQHNQ